MGAVAECMGGAGRETIENARIRNLSAGEAATDVRLRRLSVRAALLVFLGASTLSSPLGELLLVLAGGGFSALSADASGTHHFREGMPGAIRLLSHPIFLQQNNHD